MYEALCNFETPLTNSLTVLGLPDYDDAVHIINDEFSPRFGFRPSAEQLHDIYTWSHGHVGLLRTLYLLKRDHPQQLFTKQLLLAEPMVLERLQNILADLPPEKLQQIAKKNLSFVDQMLFERFGIIQPDGSLFHPLLKPLLPRQKTLTRSGGLSLTEHTVLEYFRARPHAIVSRQDIASIVWGTEEWEDKYSDWAIGQLIYRLRKKLEYGSSSGTIITRKGQGFEFVPS